MGAVSSHSARRWEHTKQAMAWLSHHSKTVATLSIIVHLSILCSHFLVEWHSGQHDWKIPRDCKCGKRDCNWDQPNECFSLSQIFRLKLKTSLSLSLCLQIQRKVSPKEKPVDHWMSTCLTNFTFLYMRRSSFIASSSIWMQRREDGLAVSGLYQRFGRSMERDPWSGFCTVTPGEMAIRPTGQLSCGLPRAFNGRCCALCFTCRSTDTNCWYPQIKTHSI